MKCVQKRFFCVFLICVLPVSASAGIISFETDDMGNGTIVGDCVIDGTTCFFDKFYDDVGEMQISLLVDSPGEYRITEAIFNETGTDWTDFHWSIVEEFGDVTIVDVISILPFTSISGLGTADVSIDDGVLSSIDVFTPTLVLNVGGLEGGSFTLTQVPTTDGLVAEPTSLLLLAVGMSGLALHRRRRT